MRYFAVLLISMLILVYGCGRKQEENVKIERTGQGSPQVIKNTVSKNEAGVNKEISKTEAKNSGMKTIKATFIELGSVNCIPCKMMKPVMEEIEKRYGDQVEVIFYDVWTDDGKPYARRYGIRAIPTQVFLDKDGKEFYRHVGFFAAEEIIKILKTAGVE